MIVDKYLIEVQKEHKKQMIKTILFYLEMIKIELLNNQDIIEDICKNLYDYRFDNNILLQKSVLLNRVDEYELRIFKGNYNNAYIGIKKEKEENYIPIIEFLEKEKTFKNYNKDDYQLEEYSDLEDILFKLRTICGKNEITKQGLEPGMIIELKNGDLFMIHELNNRLIFANKENWDGIENYNDDLELDEWFDIVKIRKPKLGYQMCEKNWHDAPIIWTRK